MQPTSEIPIGISFPARHVMAWMLAGMVLACADARATDGPLSLAGEWRFSLDRNDMGVKEGWFGRELPDRIRLPGTLQGQGYGDEIGVHTPWVMSLYDRSWYEREEYKPFAGKGNVRVPFLSQPQRHYLGAAWYQRDVTIPDAWQGRRVVLFLERARWQTTVWLDGKDMGSENSLVAPHETDLGLLSPGPHHISVCIDNRMILPYRPDAHSVSDSLGSTWNGMVGRIELRPTPAVYLDDVRVFPDVAGHRVRIKVRIGNATGRAGGGRLEAGGASTPVSWQESGADAQLDVGLPADTKTWDEFQPAIQHILVKLEGDGAGDARDVAFGLSEFRVRGNGFTINGRPVHLRGTHNGGDFPLTGAPPCDVESWRGIFRICKAWGLNHIRFHSWCPPDAAFTAADELGVYLQPECGMWNEFNPGSPMEKILYDETDRLIRAYGNHPSFVMLSASNEPKGRWQDVLPKWVGHYREADARRLYTTATGFTDRDGPKPLDQVDYTAASRIGPRRVRGDTGWFGRDYSGSLAGVSVPVVTHELGQWCAYPDFDIIKDFTGYLRPGNYEIFRDSAAAHGLLARNKDFVRASGRLQLACYKEEVEANMRTAGLAGFQLLDLHDYLGQGTALVGLLDPLWNEKGYASAADFRRFCAPTVPLARMKDVVYTNSGRLEIPVEIYHYGPAPLAAVKPEWKIIDDKGLIVAGGTWPVRDIPLGHNIKLGDVSQDLSKLAAPRSYQLVVGLQGTEVENSWRFWVYPAKTDDSAPAGVSVARSWKEAAKSLAEGGKVLLLPRLGDLDWSSPPMDRLPLFWNRQMSPGWSRMLGMWCDKSHPALAGFPTDDFGDWQWIQVSAHARAVNLDGLPGGLQPIVQPVDDWNRNWKLGLIFECRVGKGRLLVCSCDLTGDLDKRPATTRLRRSLLDYMAGRAFQPKTEVKPEALSGIFFDTRIMKKLGATADGGGAEALDGDPNTCWLEGGGKSGKKHPHTLTVHFPAPVAMRGVILMGRQNHRDFEGAIRKYVIESSEDGNTWKQILGGELPSTLRPVKLRFPSVVTVAHLRLTSLSGYGGDTTASLAEFAVDYAGPEIEDDGADDMEFGRVHSASTDVDEGPEIKPEGKKK
jgi:hypothetical protein